MGIEVPVRQIHYHNVSLSCYVASETSEIRYEGLLFFLTSLHNRITFKNLQVLRNKLDLFHNLDQMFCCGYCWELRCQNDFF